MSGNKIEQSHYRVHLDCHHDMVMSHDDIKQHLVDTDGYDVTTGGSKIVMVCKKCKNHEPGSCAYTPIHKVISIEGMYSRPVPKKETVVENV